MHGGAITIARKYNELKFTPDLILATDMLNLSSFLALTRHKTVNIPTALYFHENQLSYPWSPKDRDVVKNRDYHYSFINYISAYAADRVFFNSLYHKNTFFEELKRFLKIFPDNNEISTIDKIIRKSRVLHLGLNLSKFNRCTPPTGSNKTPLILWNHRWEYDKNPSDFIDALITLSKKDIDFEVAFLGECFNKVPEVFLKAKKELSKHIVHFGYVEDHGSYIEWLWKSDILPITSNQDFFGASMVQAVYCDTIPLLPERLTYPELIPADTFSDYYYKSQNDLVEKLEQLLTHKKQLKPLRSTIQKFDWPNIIKKYDQALSGIVDI